VRTTIRASAGGLLAVTVALYASALLAPAYAASTITNPGFESGGATGTPAGWSESGTVSASYTESGGRSGALRLSHWASAAYRVETFQTLTGLAAGGYTARAWVRSGGGQRAAYLVLRGCGSAEQRAVLPTSASTWVEVSVTAQVSGGQCTVGIVSDANAGNWVNVDDVQFAPTGGPTNPGGRLQIKGVDVSTLKKNLDNGAVYRNGTGGQVDPLAHLRANGVNYGRLKVWVNPADGYNNQTRVLEMASRIKAQGMGLLIDFHYSDAWADPGQQNKPAAWRNHSVAQLRQAVYDHTHAVLAALRAQGTPADMAQVGNEINDGMLWPEGRASSNWTNLASFLTAGAQAVRAASPGTRVVLHLAEGGNNSQHRWWFDNAVSRGVPFDVIAVSHYLYWHGTAASLRANLVDLAARYGRDVFVAETAYGFTTSQDDREPNIFNASLASAGGYPASAQGQTDALRAVMDAVAAVPNGRGLGVFYWEPTWTAVAGSGWDPTNPASGNGWENQALFDYNDRALPALSTFAAY
jgi:arabinogalactan endo-1,4-beta-galactosidase